MRCWFKVSIRLQYSDFLPLTSGCYLRFYMHRFFIKTPWWARKLFSEYVWRLPAQDKVVYLTFDDGPHPTITPWVLAELKKHGAEATFFCIGNNVDRFPETYQLVLQNGHSVGNHTYNHLNGWKTNNEVYLKDVAAAAGSIKTNLFRPPYGKIKRAQARLLKKLRGRDFQVIMWDVLSADFDQNRKPEECINAVVKNVEPGSIVVFHDSEKACPNLRIALPEVLRHLKQKGYIFKKIGMKRP